VRPGDVIVAEVSASWPASDQAGAPQTIGAKFELVIRFNASRGYDLCDWKFAQTATEAEDGSPMILETIVATFERSKS